MMMIAIKIQIKMINNFFSNLNKTQLNLILNRIMNKIKMDLF